MSWRRTLIQIIGGLLVDLIKANDSLIKANFFRRKLTHNIFNLLAKELLKVIKS